ncbi:MAG: SpoIIIAH-like family protein [Blautia sp.]
MTLQTRAPFRGKAAKQQKGKRCSQRKGEDKETASAEGETDVQTETPGEAVLTGASGFVAEAKVSREQVRSANKETLLEIINNENIGDEQKQEAIASMVKMTDLAEQEEAAELLLDAKGFENVVVNLTNDSADVIVPQEYMAGCHKAPRSRTS